MASQPYALPMSKMVVYERGLIRGISRLDWHHSSTAPMPTGCIRKSVAVLEHLAGHKKCTWQESQELDTSMMLHLDEE